MREAKGFQAGARRGGCGGLVVFAAAVFGVAQREREMRHFLIAALMIVAALLVVGTLAGYLEMMATKPCVGC